MSDLWKGYNYVIVNDEGYDHHSKPQLNFVDPDSGAHIQGNKNTWWEVKRGLPQTGTSKEHFDGYLQEYTGIWHQHYEKDRLENIFNQLANLYESAQTQ